MLFVTIAALIWIWEVAMKNKLNYRISVILAAFVLMGIMLAGSCLVQADSDSSYSINIPETLWMGQGSSTVLVQDASGETKGIDSLTLSDPTVLKVHEDKYNYEGKDYCNYDVKPAKPGKTTMTVTFTKPDGSTGTLSKVISIRNYPKEIKSLKVNGKKVKLANNVKTKILGKVDQRYTYFVKNKKTAGKVKLTPKKGWKITKVTSTLSAGVGDTFKDYSSKITKKMITKGKKFKFPKSWDQLEIRVTMQNKNGETIDYCICMFRNLAY